MATLWIEESPSARGYKHFHRVGCGDVHDPEPVEYDGTLSSLHAVAEELAADPLHLAPCVR